MYWNISIYPCLPADQHSRGVRARTRPRATESQESYAQALYRTAPRSTPGEGGFRNKGSPVHQNIIYETNTRKCQNSRKQEPSYERERHNPGNRTFPAYLVRTPLLPCFLVTAVCPGTAVTIFGRYLVILADILADIHVFIPIFCKKCITWYPGFKNLIKSSLYPGLRN